MEFAAKIKQAHLLSLKINIYLYKANSSHSYIYIYPEYADVFQSSGLPIIKWHEIVEDDIDGEEDTKVGLCTY